ncbi:MAG: hypothetical protein KKH68_02165 [Proteobacteria bacterium]|nr:hypothetical protein [Pseudomonadota bacterium]
MGDKKKRAAAIAAVTRYLKAEEEATALPAMAVDAAGRVPAAPLKMWGLSGRQAQMQMRSMLQMRTFR